MKKFGFLYMLAVAILGSDIVDRYIEHKANASRAKKIRLVDSHAHAGR
jgi:hypothetical protein